MRPISLCALMLAAACGTSNAQQPPDNVTAAVPADVPNTPQATDPTNGANLNVDATGAPVVTNTTGQVDCGRNPDGTPIVNCSVNGVTVTPPSQVQSPTGYTPMTTTTTHN